MKVAIASGKGGTGKTTVATNLAQVAAADGLRVAYVDCDVEEPNGHLFLQPTIEQEVSIDKRLPQVDPGRCTLCGRCRQVCRYGAIACVGQQALVFAELCHSCGGCVLACPAEALQEVPHPIGTLLLGRAGRVRFVAGRLNVGETMSPPAIRAVKAVATDADVVILDGPPGTSCPAIESVRGSDLVLLVTEPTPFGLYDLRLAVEMVRTLQLRLAVVLNRSDIGDQQVRQYCADERIPIVAEIADDREVAEAVSRGELAARHHAPFRRAMEELLESIVTRPGAARCGAMELRAERPSHG